ncbi:MAG: A24 family peptidase [Herpetosiphon sp.]
MNMVFLGVALLGVVAGTMLNVVVPRQVRDGESDDAGVWGWSRLPVIGAVQTRNWLALTVDVLAIGSALQLFRQYGLTAHFAAWWLGALVLIDTGVVDWQVKLIDVLLLLVATVVAVLSAPLRQLTWIRSFEGMATALVLFLLFFLIAKMLYPGQHAPFGLGDVYLGMFIGALVGFWDLPRALFYGMVLAAVVSVGLIVVQGYKKARHIPIAYGAYLCLGTLLFLLTRAIH